MPRRKKKMGFNATWSMAVGGMVGGGIFSVLGVVVAVAGRWAWLSFLIGGLIALATALAYSQLAEYYEAAGGVFTFLRKVKRKNIAGTLSWLLVFGYVLTISVYAFTFGHYLGNLLSLGAWFPRLCGVIVICVFVFVNLQGIGEASEVEIITVWGKLFVLLGLAIIGLWHWQPDILSQNGDSKHWLDAVTGAASIFMAYEGFQLLAYDYNAIKTPNKTMPQAMITAVISVIFVYIVVTLGAVMLVGPHVIIEKKEVAIAAAGRAALGGWGLWLATIAAVFSTGSAINATLFATSRLMNEVAEENQMPKSIQHQNKNGLPDRAILIIGGAALVLAVIGSLQQLVEAASLLFLFTFATVNWLALLRINKYRWVFIFGSFGAAAAALFLCWRIIISSPFSLGFLLLIALLAFFGRPFVLRKLSAGE